MKYVILVVLVVCFYAAATYRVKTRKDDIKEIIESKLSQAIVELVAIAGGIYLSLIFLMEFLNLNVPETITWMGVSFNPVAAIAVLLAVLQPLFLRPKQK
ncbi:MAG: hypothetical protein AB1420_18705 [Bacillota bacterium]